MKKKIVILIVAAVVIVQFIIPERNISSEVVTERDISKVHPTPENIHQLLIKKCYDCHSNNTNYPWYINIQPIGWWMAHHVNEGKHELNFSEFATYDKKKADHKLEELGEVVEEGEMPLAPYVFLHPETELTAEDKQVIAAWLKSLPIKLEHH